MRDYESVSSISTFLKCPAAYDLRYNKGAKAKVPEKIKIGSWVHKQLEVHPDGHPDASEFTSALEEFLRNSNDEIVETEKEFIVSIESQKFKFIVDAITKNGVFIDYKVTQSPDFYKSNISTQMGMYSACLENNKAIFLLFEYQLGKRNKNPFPKFKELHVDYAPITDLMAVKLLNEFSTTIEMLSVCKKNDIYPPSKNGCGTCFYKSSCEYFSERLSK